MIFFLLSGFVIYYSNNLSRPGTHNFKSYFIRRGRRIYPIFLLSLLLAYVIECLKSRALAPAHFPTLLGNLFMLQDHPERPGYFVLPYADNMPLWSLSYEWWFYMMFYPISRWLPPARQKYFVFLLCAIGLGVNAFKPNGICWFLVFFIIWWAGVEIAREFAETGGTTLARQKTTLGLLGIPAIWYGLITWHWFKQGAAISYITYPFVEFRYFLMAIVFITVFFVWKRIAFAGFEPTIGRFLWLGPISYALYLFHYPILCDLRLFEGRTFFYLDLLLRIGIAFLLAWLVEGFLQKWINAITDPWLKTRDRLKPVELHDREALPGLKDPGDVS